MKLVFVHYGKRDAWPLPKTFNLPETPCGAIAVVASDGRYIEIGRIFGDSFDMACSVHKDAAALQEAVVDYREKSGHEEFKKRLDAYAKSVPAPSPVEIARFAHHLAEELDVYLDDLDDQQELAGQEPDAAGGQIAPEEVRP